MEDRASAYLFAQSYETKEPITSSPVDEPAVEILGIVGRFAIGESDGPTAQAIAEKDGRREEDGG